MAWGLFCDNAWRVRVAGMSYLAGADLTIAHRRLVAAGVDQEIAEDLLAACERGFVTAMNEKDGDSGEN